MAIAPEKLEGNAPTALVKDTIETQELGVQAPPEETPEKLFGKSFVVTGDQLRVAGQAIHLFGVIAPKLSDPYGKNAKWKMFEFTKGKMVSVQLTNGKVGENTVGKCYLEDGTYLSAELVKAGLALDWQHCSGGVYKSIEPSGVKKKLRKTNIKQSEHLLTTDVEVLEVFEANPSAGKRTDRGDNYPSRGLDNIEAIDADDPLMERPETLERGRETS